MMLGARTAAWAKSGGGGIPYIQLNPENAEFRVGFVPDIVDGVEYSVDFFVGQTQTLPSRQCVIWMQGSGGISTTSVIETTAKIRNLFVGDDAIHRATAIFEGTTVTIKVDDVVVDTRTYREGAKITVFGVGGYSDLLPAYSVKLLAAEISVGGEIVEKMIPMSDNGEGKFRSSNTGVLYRTDKNADRNPPKFGFLDAASTRFPMGGGTKCLTPRRSYRSSLRSSARLCAHSHRWEVAA